MSWLEFIQGMFSALAWPIIALVAIVFLGSEIKSAAKSLVARIGDIAHLKAPGVAIDFKEVEELAATTEGLREELPTPSNEMPDPEVLAAAADPDLRFERYRLLAKVDPRAAVLLPFADLEASMREEFRRRHPEERPTVSFARMVDRYAREGLLDRHVQNSLRELASIRNRVAHDNYTVDTETAELYVQSIEDISIYVLLMPLFDKGTQDESD